MTIITITPDQFLGNTLKGAIMGAFNIKHQKDVKTFLLHGQHMFAVFQGGEWVDYDFWKDGESWKFLLAA